MVLWFTGCSITKVLLCYLSFFKFLIDRKKRKNIILPEIGKLNLWNKNNLKLLQMSAIITWMILEKCLNVDKQYFLLVFCSDIQYAKRCVTKF